ncbi:MAG: hypothetical protein FWD65_00445 [Coriobacteriia bacterium]|nr:hypothetical protein [Coriobacteriia bacterium]
MRTYKNLKIRLEDGIRITVPAGTEITKIRVFAGPGTNREVKDRFLLQREFGLSADRIMKVRGELTIPIKGVLTRVEAHWYETGGHVRLIDMKVKTRF